MNYLKENKKEKDKISINNDNNESSYIKYSTISFDIISPKTSNNFISRIIH